MPEPELDLEKLRADIALFVAQIRDSAPLADPELRAELLTAAATFEADTPRALQEYVEGMAEADRKIAESLETIRRCEEEKEQQRRELELRPPAAAPVGETLEPIGWKEARRRLLDRLRNRPPANAERSVELKDWAFASGTGDSSAESSISVVPPPSPPVDIGAAKGWTDWLDQSQSLSKSSGTPTPGEIDPAAANKPLKTDGADNPWLKAWKNPEPPK